MQHYMQTGAWAKIKSAYGWKSGQIKRTTAEDPLVIYSRSVPALGKLHYIPGVSDITDKNLRSFTSDMKAQLSKGFAVRIEPYQELDEELVSAMMSAGWKALKRHVQYRHTIIVDLSPSEEDILMSFKSRGRYEIKQAQTFGVQAEAATPDKANLEIMYKLLEETSQRNKFYIRDRDFTMKYWQEFAEKGMLKLFFAKHDGDTLAGAVVIVNKDFAWYKEGGSLRDKSNLMGPRLLLWEAMKVLKAAGILSFDLGGIPDPEKQESGSMHGIYVFKSAYSKNSVALMPAMELPLSKKYKLWPKGEDQWLRLYNLFARSLWW